MLYEEELHSLSQGFLSKSLILNIYQVKLISCDKRIPEDLAVN